LNQTVIDSEGRVINTWADIINCADPCMEVKHKRNTHNIPVDLVSGEIISVTMETPAVIDA
jgi:photosystem II P680 reaction center D1 protein